MEATEVGKRSLCLSNLKSLHFTGILGKDTRKQKFGFYRALHEETEKLTWDSGPLDFEERGFVEGCGCGTQFF